MRIITLDFETYWCSKTYTLSKMGPIEYIRDPRFRPQMAGFRVDKGPVLVVTDQSIRTMLRRLDLEDKNTIVVGHNINGFDGLILSEYYGIKPRWFLDTMVMARWVGLSRLGSESHAALTERLGNGVKLPGTAVTDGRQWYELSQAEQMYVINYCRYDVQQCSDNMYKMLDYISLDLVRFCSLTARMATEPSLYLDTQLLTEYIKELDDDVERSRQQISWLFGFQNAGEFQSAIRSSDKFCDMLRQLGVEPPMRVSARKTATKKAMLERDLAQAQDPLEAINIHNTLQDPRQYTVMTPALSKTDLDFLELRDHPDSRVSLLVKTRLANNSSILRSRAETFYNLSLTGKPLPVMLNAIKAHTSRYTAGNSEGSTDGLNLQNLNKRNKKQLTLRKSIQVKPGYKLVAVDSSQVEARLLAYVAGETRLLDIFRSGGDPYAEQACLAFPGFTAQEIHDGSEAGDQQCYIMRHVGKTSVLSAGYQVGWKKFSDTLLRAGVRLDADLDVHHAKAKAAHGMYRATNPNIVGFWGYCDRIIAHMHDNGAGQFGGPNNDIFTYGTMQIGGTDIYCPSIKMPSGFILRYPNLRREEDEEGRMRFVYDRPSGKQIIKTNIYGGALTENLIQGLAFQMLMWQACRMDESGVFIAGNNHDAWISVCLEDKAQWTFDMMKYWMSQVPSWLSGFPVACAGGIADDFTIA